MDRLSAVKCKPNSVFCEDISEALVKATFPDISFSSKEKVDLILSVIEFGAEFDFSEMFLKWKKHIKSEGVILFALVNCEVDILDLGDGLQSYGFEDVVIDREDGVIYGHAMGAKEVRVEINQIRRV